MLCTTAINTSSHFRQYSRLLWLWQIHHRHFPRSQCSVWHHWPPNPPFSPKHQYRNIWHHSFLASVLPHQSHFLCSYWTSLLLIRHMHHRRSTGSVLGPLLFTAYVSPIAGIAHLHSIDQQQYVDDTQLFISLSPSDYMPDLDHLTRCIDSLLSLIHIWRCRRRG